MFVHHKGSTRVNEKQNVTGKPPHAPQPFYGPFYRDRPGEPVPEGWLVGV